LNGCGAAEEVRQDHRQQLGLRGRLRLGTRLKRQWIGAVRDAVAVRVRGLWVETQLLLHQIRQSIAIRVALDRGKIEREVEVLHDFLRCRPTGGERDRRLVDLASFHLDVHAVAVERRDPCAGQDHVQELVRKAEIVRCVPGLAGIG
jgi:hypothetical protein